MVKIKVNDAEGFGSIFDDIPHNGIRMQCRLVKRHWWVRLPVLNRLFPRVQLHDVRKVHRIRLMCCLLRL